MGGLGAQCEWDGTGGGGGDATLPAGSWGPVAPLGTPFPGWGGACGPMLGPSPAPHGQEPPCTDGAGLGGGGAVLSKGGGREGEGRDLLFIFFFKFNL